MTDSLTPVGGPNEAANPVELLLAALAGLRHLRVRTRGAGEGDRAARRCPLLTL